MRLDAIKVFDLMRAACDGEREAYAVDRMPPIEWPTPEMLHCWWAIEHLPVIHVYAHMHLHIYAATIHHWPRRGASGEKLQGLRSTL